MSQAPPERPDPGSTTLTADAVAAAVSAVPVVRMHDRSIAGTHLPGRRVPGVRIQGQDVEVHAAVVYPTTVPQAAQAVRDAVRALTPGRVDVVIDDVVGPGDETDPPTDPPTDSPEHAPTDDAPPQLTARPSARSDRAAQPGVSS